jgi:hypothetical protein
MEVQIHSRSLLVMHALTSFLQCQRDLVLLPSATTPSLQDHDHERPSLTLSPKPIDDCKPGVALMVKVFFGTNSFRFKF